ncbi:MULTISPECIES: 6-carboxytetrahydropterin synthase [Streptomyces]|uniref:6-carboxy-5,6,7,8-tetrahydropterin synthase n=1 Tax=Streptomyces lonegramiae TaxID=3075524 RepID=A0ABU2XQW1_9ACTN|nr:6-carboxytetrahydropterin synthase [Streptomyces sp. DSM 41529]MDT0548313.1 6-carboxytetrahydropterin synthase [Streptomyces sp. DSM 41529]
MAFRISKEFHFSASHRLDGLAEGHPCGRLHGHNYVVALELAAGPDGLDPTGFVRDYGDLSAFSRWLDDDVDHRHLNDLLTDRNPSAENLARWLYERWLPRFPELSSVRVSETPKTWAEYRP